MQRASQICADRWFLLIALIGAWPMELGCQVVSPLDDVAENEEADETPPGRMESSSTAGTVDSDPSGGSGAGSEPSGGAGSDSEPGGGAGSEPDDNGCTPFCSGLTCGDDGCGSACPCPSGMACDPDRLLCVDATCGAGVRIPCPAIEEPRNRNLFFTATGYHCYEPLVTNDPVCPSGYATHLHCDLCEPAEEDYLALCWARCVCDDEVDILGPIEWHCAP